MRTSVGARLCRLNIKCGHDCARDGRINSLMCIIGPRALGKTQVQGEEQGITIAYTRVSGAAQKPDLANQMKALEVSCEQHSIRVDEWMQDIGSGLNYKRKQFNRLMEMVELGQVRRLVIAHRDRLVRFGYCYFLTFCERHHTPLLGLYGETLLPQPEHV